MLQSLLLMEYYHSQTGYEPHLWYQTVEAGNAIRTRDINLGKVALYH